MALFGKRRAGEKYTQNTGSAEGENEDQGADAAAQQSRRDADSELHDPVLRRWNAFDCWCLLCPELSTVHVELFWNVVWKSLRIVKSFVKYINYWSDVFVVLII